MDRQNVREKQKLRHAFNYFDVDGNGFITKKELSSILTKKEPDTKSGDKDEQLGKQSTDLIGKEKREDEDVVFQELWHLILEQSDENNDGQIEFAEFEQMMSLYAGKTEVQVKPRDK